MADTCPEKTHQQTNQKQTKQNKMIKNKTKDGLPPTSAKFTIFNQTLHSI
jgi:hypothetical protein